MALDAYVFCDCFETNNLRCDPPLGLKVQTSLNGDLTCDACTEEQWSAFWGWKQDRACLHYGMILLRHRLGTPEQIQLLQHELQKRAAEYPLLLQSVLYSGTHTCDWIALAKLEALADEVQRIAPESAGSAADALQLLKIKLAELIIAARHSQKPICF